MGVQPWRLPISLDRFIPHPSYRCLQYVLCIVFLTVSGMVRTLFQIVAKASSIEPCVEISYHFAHRTYCHLCNGPIVYDISCHRYQLVLYSVFVLMQGTSSHR